MKKQISKNHIQMSALLKTILLVLLIAAAFRTYHSKGLVQESQHQAQNECTVVCNRSQTSTKSANQLCLTTDFGTRKCFYVDNIILFKSYNGKTVVYDFDGNGQYIKENLKEIEEKLRFITDQFYQINRQDLVNMIYAEKLDKCKNILYLCGEFDCSVPRRKCQDVEKLMYQYCSLMCQ